jgi:hypothetical protein
MHAAPRRLEHREPKVHESTGSPGGGGRREEEEEEEVYQLEAKPWALA